MEWDVYAKKKWTLIPRVRPTSLRDMDHQCRVYLGVKWLSASLSEDCITQKWRVGFAADEYTPRSLHSKNLVADCMTQNDRMMGFATLCVKDSIWWHIIMMQRAVWITSNNLPLSGSSADVRLTQCSHEFGMYSRIDIFILWEPEHGNCWCRWAEVLMRRNLTPSHGWL